MIANELDELRANSSAVLEERLRSLSENVGGILAAQVCTSDGFEIASIQQNEDSQRRLAAMVSSLHALGSAMVEETGLGQYVNLVIEASEGKCLMMAIPGSNGELLLSAVAAPSVMFGLFHSACTMTCDDISARLG